MTSNPNEAGSGGTLHPPGPAQIAECVVCGEAWEPAGGEPDRGSHRCSLRANHDTLHRCGVCGEEWDDGNDS